MKRASNENSISDVLKEFIEKNKQRVKPNYSCDSL